MRKEIYFLVLILLIEVIYAETILYENSTFNPSQSNVTYRLNETFYGLNIIKVNETCFTINTTNYCNSSSTPIRIVLPSGVVEEITEEEIIEGEPTVVGAGASGAAGARGGSCDYYADLYKKCYFVNINGECQEGCQTWYVCNENYRCIQKERLMINTKYYFISIKNAKESYKLNENLRINVSIVNKDILPDRNGVLVTYLLGPNNIKLRLEEDKIDIIPPTCPIGEYNRFNDVCASNSTDYIPLKTIISREIALPLNSTLGEWLFFATFVSEKQELVELYDSFKVRTHRNYFWLLISLPIILTLIIVKVRKKKKKKKKENVEGIE